MTAVASLQLWKDSDDWHSVLRSVLLVCSRWNWPTVRRYHPFQNPERLILTHERTKTSLDPQETCLPSSEARGRVMAPTGYPEFSNHHSQHVIQLRLAWLLIGIRCYWIDCQVVLYNHLLVWSLEISLVSQSHRQLPSQWPPSSLITEAYPIFYPTDSQYCTKLDGAMIQNWESDVSEQSIPICYKEYSRLRLKRQVSALCMSRTQRRYQVCYTIIHKLSSWFIWVRTRPEWLRSLTCTSSRFSC